MAPTVVLVTGANRGLGQGLVQRFLAKPSHTVVAAVRNPSQPTAQELSSLPKGEGSKLVVVKYDAAVEQDAFDMAASLGGEHGIDHLDVIVANAGIAKSSPLVKDAKRADILEHVTVNVLSIVSLYQATRGLLEKAPASASSSSSGSGSGSVSVSSSSKPVFAIMGSTSGSLGRQPPAPSAAYGASKAMAVWYGVRLDAEEDWLSAFVLDPGWVQTDMGNRGARLAGIPAAPTTVGDSCDGMVAVLTDADSKAKFGGKIVRYTGEVLGW